MITREEASHIHRELDLVTNYRQAFETILNLYERIDELEGEVRDLQAVLISNGIAVENEG